MGPHTEGRALAGSRISWPLRLSLELTSWVLPFWDFWSPLEAPGQGPPRRPAPPLPVPEVRAVGLRQAASRKEPKLIRPAAPRPATSGRGPGSLQTSSRCGRSYSTAWLWLGPAASRLLSAELLGKQTPTKAPGAQLLGRERGRPGWSCSSRRLLAPSFSAASRPDSPACPAGPELGVVTAVAGCLLGGESQ